MMVTVIIPLTNLLLTLGLTRMIQIMCVWPNIWRCVKRQATLLVCGGAWNHGSWRKKRDYNDHYSDIFANQGTHNSLSSSLLRNFYIQVFYPRRKKSYVSVFPSNFDLYILIFPHNWKWWLKCYLVVGFDGFHIRQLTVFWYYSHSGTFIVGLVELLTKNKTKS